MKFRDVSYDAIIYLLILFLGYTVGGYLLAAYDVNRFILIGTALITLRLAQTGTASIALAIAWICLCFWGSVFLWSKPISLDKITPQTVASLLLLCWTLSITIVFLLAFAHKSMHKLKLDRKKCTYGLLTIVWGAMILGWSVYHYTTIK